MPSSFLGARHETTDEKRIQQEDFLAAFPMLLAKDLPYRHWRRETMLGSDARAQWVEPDLQALPA